MSQKKNLRILGGLAGVGVAAALILVPVSGADFSASETGSVSISTANLSIGLTDGQNSVGTFDLAYDNLAPGQTQSQAFTVTNAGSIAADVSIGQPIDINQMQTQGLTGADFAELTMSVPGYLASLPMTSVPGNIDLGVLNAGQSRTYQLQFTLDESAGNEWQNRVIGASATVTLDQR